MIAFFYIFNSPNRNSKDLISRLSWRTNEIGLICSFVEGHADGKAMQMKLKSSLSDARCASSEDIVLLIVHPGVETVGEVAQVAAEDSLLIVALCSADVGFLGEAIGQQAPERVLVLPVALPQGISEYVRDFQQGVNDLAEILCRIEIETDGNIEIRKQRCAEVVEQFKSQSKSKKQWRRLHSALAAGRVAGDEDGAISEVEDHYNSRNEFLQAARTFDRDRGLTWMGRLSTFHHTELVPKFGNARGMFKNVAFEALDAWMKCDVKLRGLLSDTFQFSVRDFALVVFNEKPVAGPAEGVLEILELINDMHTALVQCPDDVFEIISGGIGELSNMINRLREDWYSFS